MVCNCPEALEACMTAIAMQRAIPHLPPGLQHRKEELRNSQVRKFSSRKDRNCLTFLGFCEKQVLGNNSRNAREACFPEIAAARWETRIPLQGLPLGLGDSQHVLEHSRT